MLRELCQKLGVLLVGSILMLQTSGCKDCEADHDLNGRWASTFNCREGNQSFNGNDLLSVSQTDTAVSYHDQLSGGSFSATGEMCGAKFTWSGSGAGYTEEGVWTFSDANHFQKTTSYRRPDGSGGTCTGSGTRAP